jgi:hypothetical protein
MNINEAVLISTQCKKLLQERSLRVGSFASVRHVIGSGGARTHTKSLISHEGSNYDARTMRHTQARTKDRANCLGPKSQ